MIVVDLTELSFIDSRDDDPLAPVHRED